MEAEDYFEYDFFVDPKEPWTDILMQELADLGFESFLDTENGVKAYVPVAVWKESILDSINLSDIKSISIKWLRNTIAKKNWNEQWEKNFNPIKVLDNCVIRADFHPPLGLKYEIIINPKMSFGTGHHETTQLMMEFLLQEDIAGKKVLDMGCGTGVLGILAEKRGAKLVQGYDIDPWSTENANENSLRNNCRYIKFYLGDILSVNGIYDFILANINRNVLQNEIPHYKQHLDFNGILFLSGFYIEDIRHLVSICQANNLKLIESKERNKWVALKFRNQ